MTASELRIGNWINNTGHPCYIADAEYLLDVETFLENGVFTSIPLTEEWLIKFGFGSEQPYRFVIGHNDYSYCLESRNHVGFKDGGYFMGIRYDDWAQDPHTIQKFSYEVQYVHQLQNLYFALTGQELTIKEGHEQGQEK